MPNLNPGSRPPNSPLPDGKPAVEISAGSSDDEAGFLDLLERKLARGNQRRWQRLLAWGELLDAAGWCVALATADDTLWLGDRAKGDLERRGALPRDGAQLSVLLESVPPGSHLIHEALVRVWVAEIPGEILVLPPAKLTPRETEVWSWIRRGKTGPEIAVILGCAPRTVETHVAHLYRKIGTHDRAGAILRATDPLE